MPTADFPGLAVGYHDNDYVVNEGGKGRGRNKRNRSCMGSTFALTHLSLQVPKFNCTIWLRLKEFVCKEAWMTRGGGTTATNNDNKDQQ
jgi:hypothetical protein